MEIDAFLMFFHVYISVMVLLGLAAFIPSPNYLVVRMVRSDRVIPMDLVVYCYIRMPKLCPPPLPPLYSFLWWWLQSAVKSVCALRRCLDRLVGDVDQRIHVQNTELS